MNKIVAFVDRYSLYGYFNETALIYDSNDKKLMYHSRLKSPNINIEICENWMDSEESVEYKIINIDESSTNFHIVLLRQSCDLNMFHQLGFDYEKLEYDIPDNAPIDEIKDLIFTEHHVWKGITNGHNQHLGYILPCVSFKIINSNDFYLTQDQLDEIENEN